MKQILLINLILVTSLTLSFGQQTKVVLDSSFYYHGDLSNSWSLLNRVYYEYDNALKLVETQGYYKSSNNWVRGKNNYTYNINDLNDTIKNYHWETASNTWVFDEMSIFGYDSFDRLITSAKDNYERKYWEYNSNGLLVKEAFQFKDWSNWSDLLRVVYEYDNANNLIKETHNDFTNTFNGHNEILYTYDNFNQRTSILNIDFSYGGFVAQSKDTLIYNTQNQLVEIYYFNFYNNTWVQSNRRTIFNYNLDGTLFEKINQGRNNTTALWQNTNRTHHLYNANNHITHNYTSSWDTINQVWSGGMIETIDYNTFDTMEIKMSKLWENSTLDYTKKEKKYTYFYSEKTIAEVKTPTIDSTDNNDICPFLNPYQPFTTVNCSDWDIEKTYKLKVFNSDGNLAYSTSFNGFEGFRVEKHLDRGWYVFVVLEDGKVLQKQKILIF